MKERIYDERNKLWYSLCGDYYVPELTIPEESRPIGKWGQMHREYLKEYDPIRFNDLVLSGQFWTYLADLDEQVQEHLSLSWVSAILNSVSRETPLNYLLKVNNNV